MPRLRRRPMRLASAPLGSLRLTALYLGSWRRTPGGIATARAQYEAHRHALLEASPVTEAGPAAFWRFDPDVPERLRGSDDVGSVEEARALEAGRRRWLARKRP